eukprot:sb/3464116/
MVTWSILSALTSISGNCVLLIASLRYKALKLDKLTVLSLENMAVSDIGFSLGILATLPALAAGRQIYGDIGNFVIMFIQYMFASANTLSILILHTVKLLPLLFPFQARLWPRRRGYIIFAAVWITCLITTSLLLVLPILQNSDWATLHFEMSIYRFRMNFYKPNGPISTSALVCIILFDCVPMVGLFGTTVALMVLIARLEDLFAPPVDSTVTVLRGTRGGLQLAVGGFIFIRETTRELKSKLKVTYWYCSKKKDGCKARLRSRDEQGQELLCTQPLHTHLPNSYDVEALLQAWRRRLVLINDWRNNSQLRNDVHEIFGLPFLPNDQIIPAWRSLETELLAKHPAVSDFCSYLWDTWMDGRYPVKMWGCYERTMRGEHRTNNVSEGSNSALKRSFGHSRPVLWSWIKKMRDIQAKTDILVLQSLAGKSNSGRRTNSQIERLRSIYSAASVYVFTSGSERRDYVRKMSRFTKRRLSLNPIFGCFTDYPYADHVSVMG